MRSVDFGDPELRLRLARRLFSRPRVPCEAEPAHGYFMRLAAAHRQTSVAAFAKEVEIDIAWGDQSACLAVVLENDSLDEAGRASLVRWTPVIDGAFAHVAGEKIRRGDLSIRTRRFCMACLQESAHHRMWFDCLFMVTCPLHGIEIVDTVGGSALAGFIHALLDQSPDGTSFAAFHPRLSELPPTLEAYAMGRWGLLDRLANDFLDPFPLSDVLEAAELLGRLDIGGRLPSMPDIGSPGYEPAVLQSRGFAILRCGAQPIKDLFHGIAAQAPPTTFGIRRLFGWAGFNFRFKSDLALTIVSLMGEVGMELGRRGRIRGFVAKEGALMTVREATAKLEEDRAFGNDVGDLSAAVISIGHLMALFHPHDGRQGSPLLLPPSALSVIAEILENSLKRSAAADYLGVPRKTFDEIVLAGHIPKLGTRWGDSELEDRFNLDELDDFLARIPLRDDQSQRLMPSMVIMVSPHIPTVPRLLAHTRYDAGRFFSEVFAGDLVVMTRTSLEGGLSAFRMHLNHQPIGHAFTGRWVSLGRTRKNEVGDDRMSQRQACALLDINPPTAKALTDAGHLATVVSMNRSDHLNLERGSVERFGERYIAGKLYADVLCCNPSKVNMLAAERGVLPLLDPRGVDGEAKLMPIFAREDMRRAFGIKLDPDKEDRARVGWKAMADRMGREASVFALWHVYDGFTAMFSTTDRLWPMRVSYTFDEQSPVPQLEGEMTYAIEVQLKLGGLDAAKRIDAFEAVCCGRTMPDGTPPRVLHKGVKAYVDREAGTCHASMRAVVVNRNAYDFSNGDFFAFFADQDSWLVSMMLNIIKCSFEDGRPYDAGVFGIWPAAFTRGMGLGEA